MGDSWSCMSCLGVEEPPVSYFVTFLTMAKRVYNVLSYKDRVSMLSVVIDMFVL